MKIVQSGKVVCLLRDDMALCTKLSVVHQNHIALLTMKKSLRTHYDNLHISQNADSAEIRYAYRRLSAQYHPDRNHSEEAAEIMKMINRAYAVLSDPQKRHEHDQWIAEQKYKPVVFDIPSEYPTQRNHGKWLIWLTVLTALLILAMLLFWLMDKPAEPKPILTQSALAPNGTVWPIQAAYIDGYPLLKSTGEAVLLIDNSNGQHSVFMQIYALSNNGQGAIRSFSVPQGSVFYVQQLNPQTAYVLRYMQLDDHLWFQSPILHIPQQSTFRLPE